MEGTRTRDDEIPDRLTLHVGDEERLFERARTRSHPDELVVSPVELHQRNVQRRLREARLPADAFRFADPVGICLRVLETAGRPTAAVDRVDRLSLIRSILGDAADDPAADFVLPTGPSSRDPRRVEQIRTEVETVTNFHPERIAAWRETAGEIDDPIDDEAAELLDAALAIERKLRDRTAEAVSETALLRRATRSIAATDGSAWAEAYPNAERLTFLGLSSLSAPHTDLVNALLSATPVEVHVHFREGTGEYLRRRVPDLLAVAEPGTEAFE
jgi:ATP-dependent helicase/nuclease subunit B